MIASLIATALAAPLPAPTTAMWLGVGVEGRSLATELATTGRTRAQLSVAHLPTARPAAILAMATAYMWDPGHETRGSVALGWDTLPGPWRLAPGARLTAARWTGSGAGWEVAASPMIELAHDFGAIQAAARSEVVLGTLDAKGLGSGSSDTHWLILRGTHRLRLELGAGLARSGETVRPQGRAIVSLPLGGKDIGRRDKRLGGGPH